MSAGRLREAAALMRERAQAATSGPWFGVTGPGGYPNEVRTGDGAEKGLPILFDPSHLIGTTHYLRGPDAHHIASWHPAVALAVADWLDAEANVDECARSLGARGLTDESHAVKVADAYLATADDAEVAG